MAQLRTWTDGGRRAACWMLSVWRWGRGREGSCAPGGGEEGAAHDLGAARIVLGEARDLHPLCGAAGWLGRVACLRGICSRVAGVVLRGAGVHTNRLAVRGATTIEL